MLVLHANHEQEITFQKLIQTTGEQVAWNGRFIAVDDQLILEGSVRSLVFQFDTKKVLTNLVDFTVKDEEVLEITDHPKLQDLINMILYAFGKWGTLRGLRVEQNDTQLNKLFARILEPYYIEPSFRKENFRFYKEGMRMTYEEVIETVLKFEEKPEDEPGAEAQGLWHKLIWKNREAEFHKAETTLEERQEDRLGNNFYLVGYQCPKCSQKLHMAVYPQGEEIRIDTQEKGVYLARVYTCSGCCCFYTPRPGRLIVEGIIYEMSFGSDRKAYEDYLELLGQHAHRTANFQYNEYEALRKQRLNREEKEKEKEQAEGPDETEGHADAEQLKSAADALRQMEDFSSRLPGLPAAVFERFMHRIEEGFYPDAAVARHEAAILEQAETRKKDVLRQPAAGEKRSGVLSEDRTGVLEQTKTERSSAGSGKSTDHRGGLQERAEGGMQQMKKGIGRDAAEQPEGSSAVRKAAGSRTGAQPPSERNHLETVQPDSAPSVRGNAGSGSGKAEKYAARLGVLDRLSGRQRQELKKQIQYDKSLSDHEKREFLRPIEEAEWKEKTDAVEKKVEGSRNRNYAQIKKVMQELEKEELPAEMKRSFSQRLQELLRRRGEQEVRQIMEKVPERMDRAAYQQLERKLKTYEGVDLSPYRETLRQKREMAEKQEIADMVKRSRKTGREDYVGLMRRLEEQEFAEENAAPYIEKIQEKVRELDEQRLDEILDHVQQMDYDAAAAAYEQVMQENFLPELKNNAVEMLSRRLEKIRTDECELLVHKLQEEMQGKIKENPRHHFYPARKVMLKTAQPEETRAVDAALSAYAGTRNLFEYPIFTADTSRNHSGREGMLLTPENLFYGMHRSAYVVPVSGIVSIKASTGLLNRRITLEEADGAKHKLPYVVGTGEMAEWAAILEEFVHYLQEKPASRNLSYLVKETHDTICCFRCGHVYRGSAVCPECGYKKNT